MLATRRYRTAIPVVVAIAVLLVGFFALRSRGDDDGSVEAVDRDNNCPPVARVDVAATRPGDAVKIDVLANDTDVDGDPLVFQVLKVVGGDAVVDDAGTPTDSIDDRVLFTPDDPATTESSIEYQALDPQGGFSNAVVTVYVNPEAAPPAGVSSAAIDNASTCGDGPAVTTTTSNSPVGPVGPDTEAVDETTTTAANNVTGTTGRRTSTTKSTGKTTTTAKKTTTTSGSNPTTPPTTAPATTTTSQPGGTTTTSPINTDCAPYPPQSQQYKDCVTARAKGQPYPPVTTTAAP